MFFGSILNYLEYAISNIIFYFFFHDLQQTGMLYYISMVYSFITPIFDALYQILITYYAPVIYGEDNKRNFSNITFRISKLFLFISFLIGLGIVLFSSNFILIICIIFKYNDIFDQASICLMLYGLFFIFKFLYYIPPSVIDLESKSNPILIIHLKSTILYLSAYLLLIPLIGLIGIPCALTIGTTGFTYFCLKRIKYNQFDVKFDILALKKILISSIPIIIFIPISYFISKYMNADIIIIFIFLKIGFPLQSFLMTTFLFVSVFLIFIILLRKLGFFNSEDSILFDQLIGKKIGGIMTRILIK